MNQRPRRAATTCYAGHATSGKGVERFDMQDVCLEMYARPSGDGRLTFPVPQFTENGRGVRDVRFLRRACVERFCKQYACGALYACEYNARTNGGAATHNPIPHSFCNDRQPSSCAVHAALVRIACVERFNIELDEPCADGFNPPSESLFEAHDASTCSGAIDDARRIVPFGGSTTTAVS